MKFEESDLDNYQLLSPVYLSLINSKPDWWWEKALVRDKRNGLTYLLSIWSSSGSIETCRNRREFPEGKTMLEDEFEREHLSNNYYDWIIEQKYSTWRRAQPEKIEKKQEKKKTYSFSLLDILEMD